MKRITLFKPFIGLSFLILPALLFGVVSKPQMGITGADIAGVTLEYNAYYDYGVDSPQATTLNKYHELYVTGRDAGNSTWRTRKYDGDGLLLWSDLSHGGDALSIATDGINAYVMRWNNIDNHMDIRPGQKIL